MVLGWDGSQGGVLGELMTGFCAWERGLGLRPGEMMGLESGARGAGHEMECVHGQLERPDVAGPAWERE